ncbi:MAG: hypothetical protein WCP30_03965 [Mycobacteriaceae bacterium]
MMALRTVSVSVALCAAAVCTPTPATADPYPVAQGHYTSVSDPGWIYFLTPPGYGGARDGQPVNQFGCGIGPDGTVGCDAVPSPEQISDEPPTVVPPDANQTIAGPQQPAHYRHSDTWEFTRDVDVLPEGHQLVNGEASCLVGYQGSVSCTTGDHGFTHYGIFGYTH